MSKQEFLLGLCKGLAGLSQEDIEERLNFYSEMIDDRIDEGLSEEAAVSEIGNVDDIVSQIIADMPITKLAKERIKPKRRLKVWEIILLALGSPIWLSLLIAVFAVIVSLYITLWAVFVSVAGCSLGAIASGIGFTFNGNGLTGVAMIGAGVVCAGLSVFLFYGCKAATKGILLLTKKLALGIKSCFIKKGEA